jgi:alpha-galactosidase
MKIVLVGAGSREFGPATVADVLLSDPICATEAVLSLTDKDGRALARTKEYTHAAIERTGRPVQCEATTDLDRALEGADFVVLSIEARRYFYWSQDFHIPRKLGFPQIYGENGGPGGLFHALRNMGPCLDVARAMERMCPDAWLLNYTNPLTKLCDALTRLSGIKVVGLCHGVFGGMEQIATFLERDVETIEFEAGGLNHFTWFTSIRDRDSGEDLYPMLRARERQAHWLAQWDEVALSRVLMRVFGLYPSPGANHIGEYIRWAQEFLGSSSLQFFYDPAEIDPWRDDRVPPWIYNLEENPTATPLFHPMREGRLKPSERSRNPDDLVPSGELAIPLIEGVACGMTRHLDAVNVPNADYVGGLPPSVAVEVPATVGTDGLRPRAIPDLPEAVLALMRVQTSISQLLVDAFFEGSRKTLLQALLLDPTTRSYRNAVALIDEMCDLQAETLPDLQW